MSRDFWSERTIKARKPHCCAECGETIKAGEKYVRTAGKYDGDFSAWPMCLICVACIPQHGYAKPDDIGYEVGNMLEWYRDALEDVPESRLPEPAPVDDRTLPMFGTENAPRVVKPTYREELRRLCNLLRKTRGMKPLEVGT